MIPAGQFHRQSALQLESRALSPGPVPFFIRFKSELITFLASYISILKWIKLTETGEIKHFRPRTRQNPRLKRPLKSRQNQT